MKQKLIDEAIQLLSRLTPSSKIALIKTDIQSELFEQASNAVIAYPHVVTLNQHTVRAELINVLDKLKNLPAEEQVAPIEPVAPVVPEVPEIPATEPVVPEVPEVPAIEPVVPEVPATEPVALVVPEVAPIAEPLDLFSDVTIETVAQETKPVKPSKKA
jgi:hypothetical protein